MVYDPQEPRIRIYMNRTRGFRFIGCLGCLMGIFVLGGIAGLLVLGWKALLAG